MGAAAKKAAAKKAAAKKQVKSCKNPLKNQDLRCVDLMHYLRKSKGLIKNGGEKQSSLDSCKSWTGEGGKWVQDFRNDCGKKTQVKSCKNPLKNQDLQCVDLRHYLRKSKGLIKNGGEKQSSLDSCKSWTGEGGKWVQDF